MQSGDTDDATLQGIGVLPETRTAVRSTLLVTVLTTSSPGQIATTTSASLSPSGASTTASTTTDDAALLFTIAPSIQQANGQQKRDISERQAVFGGFVGADDPQANCSEGQRFLIADGELISENQFISTDPGAPFIELVPEIKRSISKTFELINSTLHWVNENNFLGGEARFCQIPSGVVYATFMGRDNQPDQCQPISIIAYKARQCVNGVIVPEEGSPISSATDLAQSSRSSSSVQINTVPTTGQYDTRKHLRKVNNNNVDKSRDPSNQLHNTIIDRSRLIYQPLIGNTCAYNTFIYDSSQLDNSAIDNDHIDNHPNGDNHDNCADNPTIYKNRLIDNASIYSTVIYNTLDYSNLIYNAPTYNTPVYSIPIDDAFSYNTSINSDYVYNIPSSYTFGDHIVVPGCPADDAQVVSLEIDNSPAIEADPDIYFTTRCRVIDQVLRCEAGDDEFSYLGFTESGGVPSQLQLYASPGSFERSLSTFDLLVQYGTDCEVSAARNSDTEGTSTRVTYLTTTIVSSSVTDNSPPTTTVLESSTILSPAGSSLTTAKPLDSRTASSSSGDGNTPAVTTLQNRHVG
ncbi:hypothetical protein JX265_001434 [Neoarthrinium moseri]|uniref:DUF7908 domain-containing protein n=1 Tax=Neoarthrinium moseri TaxID=1658444 RepID=A0A9Q0AUL4_9PEZI|nr:uncharacterized protein JN550_009857 [Neoarthrinium moseri]KAI1863121.1 hypothetical protein JN550_009857 [Neoarthrinium moseri]KAI1879813.1 hypothetical protein JX265_001434 [Neoarthrinium moseri]